ncbi:DEAD/DEAH box helicase [Dongia sedimenti]|uniref:DEAD/DEAH box helicase n=1 Tax=Dongia sedimenti TaxID=3064282 RepID=A0ABU0YUD3_9PROT|nr:DEAD/DEAH box helicase [Rhodospirillaceae bacterium R-7]
MKFADLGLSPELLSAIADSGYETPTPIQAQAIPTVLMGRDVLGCAQTGTGKTAAFVLPMIDILNHGRAKARMPRSLILEPTRELAAQVSENFEKYGKNCELSMALLIGGESFTDQERKLDRGVDVLIATPGRLIDLFERGKILMNDVKTLVIDEADRMLDMGFIPDVERIVSLLPKIRQTLLFSATMAPEVKRLADAFLMNPKEITVSAPATTATTVTQGLVVVDELDKREALRRLIKSEDVTNALIFCNRKKDVDILYRSLSKHGFNAAQLHGDMPQSKRTETLEKFKNNEVALMVCSDVAARGIDIKGLSHVFNFDTPHHAEDYVHRIGRTGRAGKEGRAFTFAMPEDGKAVQAIEKLIGKEIPRVHIEGINTQELSDEAPRRGRGRGGGGRTRQSGERQSGERQAGERSGGERGGRSRSGGRGRSREQQPEVRVDAIDAAIPHPAAEMHRKEQLAAATALPEIANEVADHAIAPVVIGPVTSDGLPSTRHENHRHENNRHERRAQAHAEHHGEQHGGPFGDHTPEFFAREQRRALQTTERRPRA